MLCGNATRVGYYVTSAELFDLAFLTEWLGSLVVMALDLRLSGREFDSRPPRLI